jgi:hypothetical protein
MKKAMSADEDEEHGDGQNDHGAHVGPRFGSAKPGLAAGAFRKRTPPTFTQIKNRTNNSGGHNRTLY